MSLQNTVIAPLFVDDEELCMAMISHNTLHLFDRDGNNLDREALKLPDTIVLVFQETNKRHFRLAQPNVEHYEGVLYVINKNNELIFSPTNNKVSSYCRLADNSILLGCAEYDVETKVLARRTCKGLLVYNDSLTNYMLVGQLGPYFLFKDGNLYKLYALDKESEYDEEANRYEYDEDNWKYKVVSEELIYIQDIKSDFVILWKTEGSIWSYNRINAIYPSTVNNQTLELISFDGISYDYNSIKRTFHIDSELSDIKWDYDIQILTDDRSVVLHHTNISSNYRGFTIIIDYDGTNNQFELTNQTRLGKYYNDRIECYSNSLILFSDSYGSTVYNMNGVVIIKSSNEYDYQRRRASIKDYAIFGRTLGEPHIKAKTSNNYIRYGVLKIENLNVVLPPNYNKIDYIVLKEPSSKHYREPEEYEIFIKCCIECLDDTGEGIEYWGLFKDSKLILPCNYLEIDLFRVKKFNFILITDINKHKGVYYNNHLIIPPSYQDIKSVGNYLILNRPDNKIDIAYIYAPEVIICQCDSFLQATASFEFLKNDYVSEDAIIIKIDDKYGLIDHGELICLCLYDKISIENVNPNCTFSYINKTGLTNPIWFKIQLGDKMGLYSNNRRWSGNNLTGIVYSNVRVLDWKTSNAKFSTNPSREYVIILDDSFYTENLIPFELDKDMIFRGFISNFILVFSNEKGESVEFISTAGYKKDYFLVDSDGDSIEDDDLNDVDINSLYAICDDPSRYRKVITKAVEFVFSFGENKIVRNPFYKDEDEEDDESDIDHDDNYDYERDTYYALDGEDYDSFRDNGGSIDDMMDGMGL